MLFSNSNSTVFEEAAKDPKSQKAMNEGISFIEQNNTWKLSELTKRHKIIGVNYMYKILKLNM